jgi:hypothetical protein
MSFNDDQLAKSAARQKNANNFAQPSAKPYTPARPTEEWDPQFDEATENLFGRVWQDEDFRPATAMRLREVLGGGLLGNPAKPSEIPLLLSVLARTGSTVLRDSTFSHLWNYLSDGEDDSLKPEIADALSHFTTYPGHWTPKLIRIVGEDIARWKKMHGKLEVANPRITHIPEGKL